MRKFREFIGWPETQGDSDGKEKKSVEDRKKREKDYWNKRPDKKKPGLTKRESTDRWYANQPEWGTPESTAHAKKMTPGEDENLKADHIIFGVPRNWSEPNVTSNEIIQAQRIISGQK